MTVNKYQSIPFKPNVESCRERSKLFVINKINFCDGLLDPENSLMIIIGGSQKLVSFLTDFFQLPKYVESMSYCSYKAFFF